MNIIQFLGSLELGLIYGLVAIGVYLSFRVLDFPDLTADGSFPLGAAISGILILKGVNPWLATLIAMFGGALAGTFTAWLNVRWNILHLLASILTMTALYSINLRIMGRPNIALLSEESVFTPFEQFAPHMIAAIGLICLIVILGIYLMYRFLSSEVGLAIRATGQNRSMAKSQGIRTRHMILAGIALSNSLIALAGALFTQSQGFADVTMGVGTIIVGLAAVLIGEAILPSRSVFVAIVACVIGSIIYRLVLALALNSDVLGLQASDLNLVTAGLVTLAMMLSQARQPISNYIAKRKRRS